MSVVEEWRGWKREWPDVVVVVVASFLLRSRCHRIYVVVMETVATLVVVVDVAAVIIFVDVDVVVIGMLKICC